MARPVFHLRPAMWRKRSPPEEGRGSEGGTQHVLPESPTSVVYQIGGQRLRVGCMAEAKGDSLGHLT